MADKTQLEVLKNGVSAWNVWRAAHWSCEPDLTDAHLIGLDLMGANFAQGRSSQGGLARNKSERRFADRRPSRRREFLQDRPRSR